MLMIGLTFPSLRETRAGKGVAPTVEESKGWDKAAARTNKSAETTSHPLGKLCRGPPDTPEELCPPTQGTTGDSEKAQMLVVRTHCMS